MILSVDVGPPVQEVPEYTRCPYTNASTGCCNVKWCKTILTLRVDVDFEAAISD